MTCNSLARAPNAGLSEQRLASKTRHGRSNRRLIPIQTWPVAHEAAGGMTDATARIYRRAWKHGGGLAARGTGAATEDAAGRAAQRRVICCPGRRDSTGSARNGLCRVLVVSPDAFLSTREAPAESPVMLPTRFELVINDDRQGASHRGTAPATESCQRDNRLAHGEFEPGRVRPTPVPLRDPPASPTNATVRPAADMRRLRGARVFFTQAGVPDHMRTDRQGAVGLVHPLLQIRAPAFVRTNCAGVSLIPPGASPRRSSTGAAFRGCERNQD
jgi:hypothetical protein